MRGITLKQVLTFTSLFLAALILSYVDVLYELQSIGD